MDRRTLLVALVLPSLAAVDARADNALDRVKKRGTLRWGGDVQGGEPYAFLDPKDPDKMVGFDSPVYGPVAFGTSARSATLTDWPGGGFVGVHGTNEPQILPGYVSHLGSRMPNEAILELARLMQVGTPITIL